ncbi:MAG: tyrosine-type recombinase/integrase [Verrucomicrobiota bacterium]
MSPRFQSRWSAQLEDFVRFKQALGQSYARPIKTLQSFDRFAAAPQWKKQSDLVPVLNGWLNQFSNCKPVTVGSYLAVFRQFCQFRKRYDPDAVVPDRSWAPTTTAAPFLPHIFSLQEIRRIITDTARVHGTRRTRRCFRLLVIVLYCTGLRIGEALALRRGDLDLRQACFRIGPSKGRSRWVPFRRDLARELHTWIKEEDGTGTLDSFVFAQDDGRQRRVKSAAQTLRFLLRRCGLKPAKGRRGPRCHDLRHTFAVHRLQRWYHEGRDLHRMLPWLSAYLGHRNLIGTEHYLQATPELLAIASRRLQRQFRREDSPT